ncbi:hypothetical protein LPB73_03260 [Tardiphaga sp. 37S4]|uniref:hypothetical protein n=1 Tax=Tardiphaga sp. 37S4 TaxID=1404741 RepID=UPI001E4DF1FD|nr:hypothetical protein [Tardiphaga sp. 37S4]UFS76431.1 hypothetical protein LPB73_03260 [Tardiphaga sp. 37S4]
MRKVLLALAALATIGIAVPAATSQADAQTVVVRHGGGHHGGYHRGHRANKVVIVKRGHGHMHRGIHHGHR